MNSARALSRDLIIRRRARALKLSLVAICRERYGCTLDALSDVQRADLKGYLGRLLSEGKPRVPQGA